MIVPSVFVFSGGSQESLSAGPTLMFITIPKVFNSMVGGNVLGAAFFVLVLFAALTSAISLMETVVSIFVEKAQDRYSLRHGLHHLDGITFLIGLWSSE